MKEDLLINVSSPGIVSWVSAHAPCFISSFYVMHAIYNLGKAGRNHELCPCCMIFMATMTDRQRYKIYSLVPHVFNAACNNKNMGVAWGRGYKITHCTCVHGSYVNLTLERMYILTKKRTLKRKRIKMALATSTVT